jgi:Protein of unknown function (DUF3570)
VTVVRQSSGRLARGFSWCATMLACLASGASQTRAEQSATAAVYVRTDTDHTRVVSPRLKVRTAVPDEDTHVDLAYTADVWTSASVDIVASASQPVTEQRDELNFGLDHVFGDLTLAAAYRYSTEPDYVSHGGSLGGSWDLADRATTLALTLSGSADRVGRSGDDNFSEEVSTLAAGLSLTQVIDTDTLVQLVYDLAAVRGYQASAYRYVAFGSAGPCEGAAPFCLPEQNPRERMRHALALRARRALTGQWSVGGGYRLYLDDWGVLSHTAKADVAWAPQPRATVALGYRFYTQSQADHYRVAYQPADVGLEYFTRDKELSPLSSHRVSVELDWLWELDQGRMGLLTAVALATTFYDYRDFAMLSQSTAFEITAVTGLEFE